MNKSIEDNKKLADIYLNSVLVEMDVSSVVGGGTGLVDKMEATDDYAPGDNRIPKVLGAVQTRKGKMGTTKSGKIKNILKPERKIRKKP